ncbi:MAG: FUSC family protein [Acidobacteria bacterium]|nr:FUSC family protein [Acidobacteriota bacterium]MBK9708637.1 FUSC family protein [Acidobacteriota bacterium]
MNQQQLSQLSDNELLEEFRKIKPSPLIDAFLIGFLIGIIIFGIAVSAWGFTILIPLFLIYLFLKKSTRYESLKKELRERNLR